MAKFLDLTGLGQFLTKVKEWANGQFVVKTRKVNGKALSADITLSASDVSAIPASQKGAANGVAELDSTGKVPSTQLPSYVDDVLEYDSQSDFPETGESGKIYMAKDTNKTYRWGGTSYVEIAGGVALGETAQTAYRGDRGKDAYDHSQLTSGNPHNVSKSDVGLGNVTNDKQMKGLASGTTNGHVMAFGADGYTPKDTGFTLGKSVPANAIFTDTTYSKATASADGLMSKEDYTKLAGITPDDYLTDADLVAITEEEIDALFA